MWSIPLDVQFEFGYVKMVESGVQLEIGPSLVNTRYDTHASLECCARIGDKMEF